MTDAQENNQKSSAAAEGDTNRDTAGGPSAQAAEGAPERLAPVKGQATDAPGSRTPREQETQEVREYDFRRPQYLSAQQMKDIQRAHISVATALEDRLGCGLNAELKIRLEKVEELTYGLLMEGLPEHAYANVVDLGALETADPGRPPQQPRGKATPPRAAESDAGEEGGRGLLLIDSLLCLAFVDRVLGGNSTAVTQPRPLTAVDEAAVEGPSQIILRCLQDGWSDLCPISLAVAERRNDVRHLQLHEPTEVMLAITLGVAGDLGEGRIRVCFPIAGLKSALGGAVQRGMGQHISPENAPLLRTALAKSLGQVALPLTAAIGTGEASIRSLANLRAGDIVRIDHQADEPIALQVDGRPTFLVRMGLQGRNKAVQVLERVQHV